MENMFRIYSKNNKHSKLLTDYFLLYIAVIATIIPFWFVRIVPSTDLPQHLSQIFLLEQTLLGLKPEFTVSPWYYANTLIYVPMLVFWKLAPPLIAGQITLSFLASSWILSSYWLAKNLNRPLISWLITTPLIFNFLFTWGLLNFLIGWPIFCLFIQFIYAEASRYRIIKLAFCALLLYYAHSLWFLIANIWLFVICIDEKFKRENWDLFLSMVPAWLAVAFWYPKLSLARSLSGVSTTPEWLSTPAQRLHFDYLVNSALGATNGPLEGFFFAFLLVWIVLVLISYGYKTSQLINRSLFIASTVLFLIYWTAPDLFMNTIFFNRRWFPCCLILLFLSLPEPLLSKNLVISIGVVWIILFSMLSSKAFYDWENEQTTGFLQTLGEIDKKDKVFGLNIMDGSLYIKGRPGLQLFSYVQALRGAETNFSFTEHASGIVQYKTPLPKNETRQYIHSPLLTLPKHIVGFNKILVNGDEPLHEFAKNRLDLELIYASNGTWRLYKPHQTNTPQK